MTMNDLQEYAEFNREFLTAVQAAKKAGKTVDEIASELDDAGEVRRLCGATARAAEGERAGRLRRAAETIDGRIVV